jgi:hypothetical protein
MQAMTSLDTSPAPMSNVAVGWALSGVLVVLALICAGVALLWPTSALGQGWTTVFGPGDSILGVVEAVAGSIAAAWLITIVFVGVHNRLVSRSQS